MREYILEMKILYIYAGKETDKKRIDKYFKDLESVIKNVKRIDTTVEIRGLSGEIPEEEEVIFWYSHPYIHEAEYSLKEILNIPVIGVGEACFNLSCLLGRSFSIITYNKKVQAWLKRSIDEYRVKDWCTSIRPVGMELIDALKLSPEEIGEKFLVQAKAAVDEDEAEVVILGSAGFVGLADYLRESLKNIPIIDPVEAGVKYIEMLVDLYKTKGILQSKTGTYMGPQGKS